MSEAEIPATPQEPVVQSARPALTMAPLTTFAMQDEENTYIMVQAPGDPAVCLFQYPRKFVALAKTVTVIATGGYPPFGQNVQLVTVDFPAPEAPAPAVVATRQQRRAAKASKGKRR